MRATRDLRPAAREREFDLRNRPLSGFSRDGADIAELET
jgi:hypothetical protein